MHDHGQIYSGIEGVPPGRFAALVTKHEVVTLGKLARVALGGPRPARSARRCGSAVARRRPITSGSGGLA